MQRPLVRVREEIGEDSILSPYWRFDERYADQIGVGAHGDLPGEFKFQYGAAVLHGSALDQSHYAIYGSLFVLVPDDDPDGTRTFPPFQGNGGGPSGGPLFTLKGEEIDLFIHLTGVRPGSVLETGNTFALSGCGRTDAAGKGGLYRHCSRWQQTDLQRAGQFHRLLL